MNLAHYKALTTDLLDLKVKEQILTDVANFPSYPNQGAMPEGYTINYLDHFGRVAVVAFRGVEVLLLFKRMTSQLSTTNLEIAPQAYLKNDSEAWAAFKLFDAYAGLTQAVRIKELELHIVELNKLLNAQTLALEENDKLLDTFISKRRKKDLRSQANAPKPYIVCNADINAYLLKIKPLKLQDLIREIFLGNQGFGMDLQFGTNKPCNVPPKYAKKQRKHISKIHKIWKDAFLKPWYDNPKNTAPYEPRPPKQRKKKTVKKVVKKVVKKGKKKKP